MCKHYTQLTSFFSLWYVVFRPRESLWQLSVSTPFYRLGNQEAKMLTCSRSQARQWEVWDLKPRVSDSRTYSLHSVPPYPAPTFILPALRIRAVGWAVRCFWHSPQVGTFIFGFEQHGGCPPQNTGGGRGDRVRSRLMKVDGKALQYPTGCDGGGWTLLLAVTDKAHVGIRRDKIQWLIVHVYDEKAK